MVGLSLLAFNAVCLHVCLFACLSVYNLSVRFVIRLRVFLFVCVFFLSDLINLSFCRCVCLSVCLFSRSSIFFSFCFHKSFSSTLKIHLLLRHRKSDCHNWEKRVIELTASLHRSHKILIIIDSFKFHYYKNSSCGRTKLFFFLQTRTKQCVQAANKDSKKNMQLWTKSTLEARTHEKVWQVCSRLLAKQVCWNI